MEVRVVEPEDQQLHRPDGHVVSLVRSADQSPRGGTASSTLVRPGLGCPPACAADGASSHAEAAASSSYVAGDGVWDPLRHAWAPAVVALACRHFSLAISLGGWSSCFTLRRAPETRAELSSKPPAHPRRPPIPTSTPPPTTSRRLDRRPSREANSVTGHPLSRTVGRPRRRHQHHVGNIRDKGPLAQRSPTHHIPQVVAREPVPEHGSRPRPSARPAWPCPTTPSSSRLLPAASAHG
jgi:hypothetical protein